MTELTPVSQFTHLAGKFCKWYAKREDRACFVDDYRPSGAKVRQFRQMIANSKQNTPIVVGCSALAAMQIYAAAAAEEARVNAYVFVPRRALETDATQWARRHGAIIDYVVPGYPSQYRSVARLKAKELGGAIRWDMTLAIEDAAAQVANIPARVDRIVVPAASGVIAAGVLVGLARLGRIDVDVLCVHVSDLTTSEQIIELAQQKCFMLPMPRVESVRHQLEYGDRLDVTRLPDDTVLDGYYAAKALQFIKDGDCLWVSGRRPLDALGFTN
jgi:1-aminocyclopropane-1-carboxylate deaminase/D-cysteine desulfhydrase-like pyridoxal-dependent ACC family enzyme